MSPDTQWEYRVLTLGSWLGLKPEVAEAQLNELGAVGWEVISTNRDSADRMVVVAKRPLTATERRRRSQA
jgi:hypothetical protein